MALHSAANQSSNQECCILKNNNNLFSLMVSVVSSTAHSLPGLSFLENEWRDSLFAQFWPSIVYKVIEKKMY